jgi:hypothetical protein
MAKLPSICSTHLLFVAMAGTAAAVEVTVGVVVGTGTVGVEVLWAQAAERVSAHPKNIIDSFFIFRLLLPLSVIARNDIINLFTARHTYE